MKSTNEENQIQVWDIFVRLFHWSLVIYFTVAFLSSEEARSLHVKAGYTVLILVIFRIIWGFIGTKHARFSDFLYSPRQVVAYLKGLVTGKPKHYIGHNPAGGLMIMLLMVSLALLTLTGIKTYGTKGHGPLAKTTYSFVAAAYADEDNHEGEERDDHRGRKNTTQFPGENEREDIWEEIHESIANLTLFLVIIHICGAVVSSYVHKENLVKAMITGRKRIP